MRLIVYLGNYQTTQSYLSSSTMCYPKWASRSAGNVLQINQHLNEAVGTVWRHGLVSGRTQSDRIAPWSTFVPVWRARCRGGAHMCHRQAHNGLFIGSPGDAIHTKHPLQTKTYERQTPAAEPRFINGLLTLRIVRRATNPSMVRV